MRAKRNRKVPLKLVDKHLHGDIIFLIGCKAKYTQPCSLLMLSFSIFAAQLYYHTPTRLSALIAEQEHSAGLALCYCSACCGKERYPFSRYDLILE